VRVKEVVAVVAGVVAVIVGVLWRAYELIAIGAGSVGLPEIFNRKEPQTMWRTRKEEKADRLAENKAAPTDGPPTGRRPETFQPEADASVFLPEDNENQTSAREEFVKNLGLEK
jgi:hypothetical protein